MTPMRILAFPILTLLILASPCRARETGPAAAKYTVAELAALALKNAGLVGVEDARIEETRLSAAQARVWAGPTAGFLAGRTRQSEGSGPRFELSAAQPIPLTGMPGLRGGLLDLETESRRLQRAAAEIFITLTVAEGAYEYDANRRKAAFAGQRRKRFELVSSYLAGRVFPTPQRKAESRIVANRVKALAAEAILSEAGCKASLEKLKTYVPFEEGISPDVEVPWLSGGRSLDTREWLERALVNNPELRVRRLAARGAGMEEVLASREGLPDTALVASYERGQADIVGTGYGLGVSLSFPSWNRNRSGVRSAQQKKLAEERRLGVEERRLKADLTRALIEYEAARLAVLQYPREVIRELESQLAEADEGFRKGQVDLLTFLEADASASEAFARALDAQVRLASKAAALLAAAADKDALTKLGSF